MFNDKVLKINVKSCITKAIKLRKKYFNKVNPKLVIFLCVLLIKEVINCFCKFYAIFYFGECLILVLICWSYQGYDQNSYLSKGQPSPHQRGVELDSSSNSKMVSESILTVIVGSITIQARPPIIGPHVNVHFCQLHT